MCTLTVNAAINYAESDFIVAKARNGTSREVKHK
jgi:hypothetical protein